VGLEDGILRLGRGRDAGLRNLLKFGDGGWRSPVNAFGVLGEPGDGANGTAETGMWPCVHCERREVRAGWRRIDDGGGKGRKDEHGGV
jgi:hypothetical protein